MYFHLVAGWERVVKGVCRWCLVGTTVRHPVLIGEHELTLDEKKRLLIPADIRRSIPAELGEGFYVVKGINGQPWLYVEKVYEDVVMDEPADMVPEDDLLAYNQLVFGLAAKLSCDKQGRILVPDRAVRWGGLEKEVTLVGVKDHVEIWSRSSWNIRRDELEKRAPEVFRARQSRLRPPVSQAVR